MTIEAKNIVKGDTLYTFRRGEIVEVNVQHVYVSDATGKIMLRLPDGCKTYRPTEQVEVEDYQIAI